MVIEAEVVYKGTDTGRGIVGVDPVPCVRGEGVCRHLWHGRLLRGVSVDFAIESAISVPHRRRIQEACLATGWWARDHSSEGLRGWDGVGCRYGVGGWARGWVVGLGGGWCWVRKPEVIVVVGVSGGGGREGGGWNRVIWVGVVWGRWGWGWIP